MRTTILLALLLSAVPLFGQPTEQSVATQAKAVTVFIDGAQVTRLKTIDLTPGDNTLKFINLSPHIDAKSIQAKASGAVTVMSVAHQYNYTDSIKWSRELEEIKKRLEKADDQIRQQMVQQEIIIEELAFLRDNRAIGGKNQELNLSNLKATTEFYRERISILKTKEVETAKNIEKLVSEKAAIEKQLKQAGASKPEPVSEVIVKINSSKALACPVELSYYVANAGWFPSYDIRVNSIEEPVQMIYKANIRQNTKEDWKDIQLKLSSSIPSLGNVAPELKTYWLNYNTTPPRYVNLSNQVSGQVTEAETGEPLPGATILVQGTTIGTVSDVNGRFSLSIPAGAPMLEVSYVGMIPQTVSTANPTVQVALRPSGLDLEEIVVVGYGAKMKSLIMGRAAGLATKSGSFKIPVEQNESHTSVEFEIQTPYSLASGTKILTVDIDHLELEASYEYYCAPKADKDAFLMAFITNWEQHGLMEGETNLFYENTWIGKSILDTRAISDTLKISLGRDRNVIVKREKVKSISSRQFIGSKKEESRQWQITVRNNKKQPIKIHVFDQVPVSTSSDIEVIVENTSGATQDKASGALEWNMKIEPASKREITLKYRVKYPKERSLNIE